jgi:hypothetical protein
VCSSDLIFIGDPGWADYDVSVFFNATDDDAVGILARYVDEHNYYRFSVDNERSYARLVARIGGAFVLLDEDLDFPGYTQGVWTELALIVDGDSIEAYVDDELVLSATSSAHPAGAVGLYSWGNEDLYFDDWAVVGLE